MINLPPVARKASKPSSADSSGARVRAAAPHAPLVQLLVLLPLVVLYEAAVPFTVLRTGWYHRIDAWSQAALGRVGLTAYYLPGVLILLALLVVHLWRRDPWTVRADQLWKLWGESLLWIVPLFVLYLLFTLPVGKLLSTELALLPRGPDDLFSNVVLAVGAGLFEEFVFRLVLVSLVLWLLRGLLRLRVDAAQLIAVCFAAAVFASAHHFGPGAEPYSHAAFLFRVAAGIYLGAAYLVRGFATAAIVHAGFNISLVLLGLV